MENLYSLLPPIIQDIQEFKAITESEQKEFDKLEEQNYLALNNQFIETAENYALTKWEKMLQLSAIPSNSIENRRRRIFAFLRNKRPYSLESLEKVLIELCGEDNVDIDVMNELERPIYSLEITLSPLDYCNLSDVKKLLKYLIPCNISYTVVVS